MIGSLDCFFIFIPLMFELLEKKVETKDFFSKLDEEKNRIKWLQMNVRTGLD